MEIEIKTKTITKKEASNGAKYVIVETDKGKFGVWEPTAISKILPYARYKVLVEERGNYKNIVEVLEELGSTPETANKYQDSSDSKVASVLLSYAKDLVVADKVKMEELVDTAIKLANAYKEIKKVCN